MANHLTYKPIKPVYETIVLAGGKEYIKNELVRQKQLREKFNLRDSPSEKYLKTPGFNRTKYNEGIGSILQLIETKAGEKNILNMNIINLTQALEQDNADDIIRALLLIPKLPEKS